MRKPPLKNIEFAPCLVEKIPHGDGGFLLRSPVALRDYPKSLACSAERPLMILSGNSIDHALLTLGAYAAGVPVVPVSVSSCSTGCRGTIPSAAIIIST